MYLLTHTERKSGLGSISLAIGYNAASITKQTKVDIEKSLWQKECCHHYLRQWGLSLAAGRAT